MLVLAMVSKEVQKSVIAVIPARGGSKRIPQKNIRNFCGKPIIQYAIEALKSSNLFHRIIVSTDSEKIAEISRSLGAEVPFIRDSVLSTDDTPTIDVIIDALTRLGISGNDEVCCVYPTNPLLNSDLLKKGLDLLREQTINCYVSPVVRYSFPIQRALVVRDGFLEMKESDQMYARSQDLELTFHESSQFWWALGLTWLSRIDMQSKIKGIFIPEWLQQDIDNEEDWKIAEIKYQTLFNSSNLNFEFKSS